MLRWLSIYVALSRPRSLSRLRSIGLTDSIKTIIEEGPPSGLVSHFKELFGTKIDATSTEAAWVLRELGWADT